ncbi:hypothetical protein Gotri_023136 [Gossypium trilobum]|uniref:RNase H type-1 domain-containing protein n=1 Tax=Gossypium trilobum TaxID=34281 RepID=A0A7J9DIB2_9ROSI|nr:hypothetical protein [Gossypium trilobum]
MVSHLVVQGGDDCWQKSSMGRYKCNVDNDASFVDSECMGWAIVVHNDMGDFVRCISRFMKSKLDLFKTEILATREVLSLLRFLHVDGVIMEIDSQQL